MGLPLVAVPTRDPEGEVPSVRIRIEDRLHDGALTLILDEERFADGEIEQLVALAGGCCCGRLQAHLDEDGSGHDDSTDDAVVLEVRQRVHRDFGLELHLLER